jgi:DNA topoisomerase-1
MEAMVPGLRYVSDEMPGIRRKKRGSHFAYVGVDGKPLRDEAELTRIRALAIPPAYVDVWICPLAHGHIQATARDARGRKQYRYHKLWREARDETKFERVLEFAERLPALRQRVAADLALAGLPRAKVLATAVQLLETTSIRIGNEEYARENASYGITTLLEKHVSVHGSHLRFHFRGKSGVQHVVDVTDRRLARIVQRMQELPGQELFSYVDEEGAAQPVDSSDVNDYVREATGGNFTAKDFRTWIATLACAEALGAAGAGRTVAERKANVNAALAVVAARLGNTPAVCRKAYVHPRVIEAYLDDAWVSLHSTRNVERALVRFLRRKPTTLRAALRRSVRQARRGSPARATRRRGAG